MNKKSLAACVAAAVVGLGLVSPVTFAQAAPPKTCADTTRTNIPIGDPDYAPRLDRNKDGIACESKTGSGNGEGSSSSSTGTGNSSSTGTGNNSAVSSSKTGSGSKSSLSSCSDTKRRNIPKGDPQYSSRLDGDHDGIACESAGDKSAGSSSGLPSTGV